MSFEEIIEEICKSIKEIYETGKSGYFGGVMTAAVLGIFYLTRKQLNKIGQLFIHIRENQLIIPRVLKHYKKELEKETLKLNHSWKLEEQSLDNLIIPINVFDKNKKEYLSLSNFIKHKYSKKENPRLLLTGEAGSGKSVAMGFIAREIWKIEREKILLPIFLTFTDIKKVETNEEFENIIICILEKYQFERSKKNQRAENYVQENLYKGNILLLLDGLDELEKSTRFEIARFLNQYFRTFPQIPFVISCRNAVWKQNKTIFPSLDFERIVMADFTSYEIQKFISKWNFTGKKTLAQLSNLINTKIYLRNIATNPLMLNIIVFIYIQSGQTLPGNRMKFYNECIEALIKKWDNHGECQLDAVDKRSILSRLAYEHITDIRKTDQNISKEKILQVIEDEMRCLARPIEKREQMLIEIVQNEFLIELPSNTYKFQKRTFMEYFAANYFLKKQETGKLLKFYSIDNGKWQETLAFYCGLANIEMLDEILNYLKNDFIKTKEEKEIDTFIFKVLVESERVKTKTANEILCLAKKYLSENIHAKIIEQLGYIATNINWSYSTKAKEILIKLLCKDLSNSDLQKIVFALIYQKDTFIQKFMFEKVKKIGLFEFIINIEDKYKRYTVEILKNISTIKLKKILLKLKNRDRLDVLFNLLVSEYDEENQMLIAYVLALTSGTNYFFRFLDTVNLERITPELNSIIKNKFKPYIYFKTKTLNGKKALFLISYLASKFIISKENEDIFGNQYKIDFWLRFFISNFLRGNDYNFSDNDPINEPYRRFNQGVYFYWGANTRNDIYRY